MAIASKPMKPSEYKESLYQFFGFGTITKEVLNEIYGLIVDAREYAETPLKCDEMIYGRCDACGELDNGYCDCHYRDSISAAPPDVSFPQNAPST